jgi:regulatory protein
VAGSDSVSGGHDVPAEHLAPVTYLFGATAPAVESETPVEKLSEPPAPALAIAPAAVPAAAAAAAPAPAPAPRTTDGSFERVNNVAMHALARRGMSSAEMTSLLESREIDPDSIVDEIDRLEGVGLLDDKALAETLVRTLHERKGLGRSAINAELRRRKIDAETISEALESVDVDDELARAIELAQKRASQLRSYDHETAKRRLSGYLMRRGYSGSVVSAAIAASLGAPGRGSGGSGPRFT